MTNQGWRSDLASMGEEGNVPDPKRAIAVMDFDGVPELPLGMTDVGDLGALREVLEDRDLPVRAIFGENVLRVLEANEPQGS